MMPAALNHLGELSNVANFKISYLIIALVSVNYVSCPVSCIHHIIVAHYSKRAPCGKNNVGQIESLIFS